MQQPCLYMYINSRLIKMSSDKRVFHVWQVFLTEKAWLAYKGRSVSVWKSCKTIENILMYNSIWRVPQENHKPSGTFPFPQNILCHEVYLFPVKGSLEETHMLQDPLPVLGLLDEAWGLKLGEGLPPPLLLLPRIPQKDGRTFSACPQRDDGFIAGPNIVWATKPKQKGPLFTRYPPSQERKIYQKANTYISNSYIPTRENRRKDLGEGGHRMYLSSAFWLCYT